MDSQPCYLCGASATITGADYGRRHVVRCQRCGYYEVEHPAIKHIQSDDFGMERREDLRNAISAITRGSREAEIVLSGNAILVRGKLA